MVAAIYSHYATCNLRYMAQFTAMPLPEVYSDIYFMAHSTKDSVTLLHNYLPNASKLL